MTAPTPSPADRPAPTPTAPAESEPASVSDGLAPELRVDPNLRATIAAFGTRTLARPRGPSDQEVAIRPDAPGPGHYDSPEIRKILAAFAAGELALLPGQLVPHTICQLAETPPEKRASSDPASITPEEQKEGPS